MQQETGSPIQCRLASAVCAQLHRAYRDIRFYPPGHPSVRSSLDALGGMLTSYLEAHGALMLEVQENQLLCDGQTVYSYDTGPDNLAFLMFRDGIRSLSFHPGLKPEEIEAFATCLAFVDNLLDAEHDLVTRLWEQDFEHIDYHVADPFLGGEVLREGEIDALRETVLRRLDEVKPETETSAGTTTGELRQVEPRTVDLRGLMSGATELDPAERVVEEASNLVHDFLVVLLEIAGRAPEAHDHDAPLARALATVVDLYADDLNIEGLELVLAHLQRMEVQGRCPAGFSGLVMSRAITAERVGRLLAARGQEAPPAAPSGYRPEQFLRKVLPWVVPALLEALILAEDRSLRRILIAILESGGGISATHLIPLLADSRWYVARNAVQLAAGVHDLEILPHLQKVARHPDPRVRREVVRTLDTYGSRPSVLHTLALALNDEDSAVRTLAARSLGRHGGKEQEAQLSAHIDRRDFDGRPEDEVDAFLAAYANLAQERAIPLLDRLWKRRLFAVRPLAVRAAALKALATIPGAAASASLRDAAKSGEKPIRKIAEQALRATRSGEQS